MDRPIRSSSASRRCTSQRRSSVPWSKADESVAQTISTRQLRAVLACGAAGQCSLFFADALFSSDCPAQTLQNGSGAGGGFLVLCGRLRADENGPVVAAPEKRPRATLIKHGLKG